jgi:plasmid stability protein
MMRTTIQIDDDLFQDLKERAHREGTSMTRLVNLVLRQGLQASQEGSPIKSPYREKTFPMGLPKVNLVKALALADALEDDEIREKAARRK